MERIKHIIVFSRGLPGLSELLLALASASLTRGCRALSALPASGLFPDSERALPFFLAHLDSILLFGAGERVLDILRSRVLV